MNIYDELIDTIEVIENELKSKIALYMMPDVVEKIDIMPLNINGKIDRVKIRKQFIKEDRY